MFRTHVHRTTCESVADDRSIGFAVVDITVVIRDVVAPGSVPDVELDRVDVLCAPGTRLTTRRPAPAPIWSWAEAYLLDHAADLIAEAALIPTLPDLRHAVACAA